VNLDVTRLVCKHSWASNSDIFSYLEEDEQKDFVLNLTLDPDQQESNKSGSLSCYAYVYEEGTCLNVNTISAYVEANRYVSL